MSIFDKHLIDIIAALLAPTIAITALFIASFQLHLANTKLKHDLFERRYVVYESINKFIGETLNLGNSNESMQRDFLNKTNCARFLFDNAYVVFINKVWAEVIDLETSCAIIHSPNNETERKNYVLKRAELKKSLAKKLGELNSYSEPFLKLRELRKPTSKN